MSYSSVFKTVDYILSLYKKNDTCFTLMLESASVLFQGQKEAYAYTRTQEQPGSYFSAE